MRKGWPKVRFAYTDVFTDLKLDHCLLPALPAKAINFIPLPDADFESSLSFVMQELLYSGIESGISVQQMAYVERLGGRASDLQSVSPWISPLISLLTSFVAGP